VGRSAFSQFIKKMVNKDLIKKIKHGKKTLSQNHKEGLDKVFRFWEEYPSESWHEP